MAKYILSDPVVNERMIWDKNIFSYPSYCDHVEAIKFLLDDPRIDPTGDSQIAVRRALQSRRGYS